MTLENLKNLRIGASARITALERKLSATRVEEGYLGSMIQSRMVQGIANAIQPLLVPDVQLVKVPDGHGKDEVHAVMFYMLSQHQIEELVASIRSGELRLEDE